MRGIYWSGSRESAVPTRYVRIHSRLVAGDSTPLPFQHFHNGLGLPHVGDRSLFQGHALAFRTLVDHLLLLGFYYRASRCAPLDRPSVRRCQREEIGYQEKLLALFPSHSRRHRLRIGASHAKKKWLCADWNG